MPPVPDTLLGGPQRDAALRRQRAAVKVPGLSMRIGGIDVGDRRIGVAISDEKGWTAQGLQVVTRTVLDADLEALRACFASYLPSAIVVGLQKNMNGTIGPQAEKALDFGRRVEAVLGVTVIMWDERLSTVGAERALLEADLSRAKRRKVIDKMAAVFILQGYLDSLQSTANP